MLETAQVSTTVLKFNPPQQPPSLGPPAPSASLAPVPLSTASSTMSSSSSLTNAGTNLLTWESDAIKLESPDVFEDFTIGMSNNGSEFVELKPLAYDYPAGLTTVSIGSSLTIDPVLSSNNNNKGMTDLNLSSPSSVGSISSTTTLSISLNNNNVVSTSNGCSQQSADVTSSSPPGSNASSAGMHVLSFRERHFAYSNLLFNYSRHDQIRNDRHDS